MGRAGVGLGANQSNIHYFRTKTRHTKIPWSSQKMQIVLLACLAAALVLVPAANAQVVESKPGMKDIHTGICWDIMCVNQKCDEGRDETGQCIHSGCPKSDNKCEF